MNKHNHHSPRPYKGHGYRVIVDGQTIKTFRTLHPLTYKQQEQAAQDYKAELLQPKAQVEAWEPLSAAVERVVARAKEQINK